MNSIPGNIELNLEKAEKFIKKSKENKADLIVFPELFNVGYNLKIISDLKYDFIKNAQILSDLASKYKIFVIAGILEIDDNQIFNSVLVFNDKGENISKYRKNNLFKLTGEDKIFKKGNNLEVFKIKDYKFGLQICFDIRFSNISKFYRDKDCDGIIVVSAFPHLRLEHFKTILKCRAIENQMYVIVSNRTGKDNGIIFCGNSCIIDPWGEIKNSLNENEEGIIFSKVNKNKIKEVRSKIPMY